MPSFFRVSNSRNLRLRPANRLLAWAKFFGPASSLGIGSVATYLYYVRHIKKKDKDSLT